MITVTRLVPLAALLLLLLVALGPANGTATTAHAQGPIAVGIDLDPTGNSCPGDGVHDCTLGSTETCVDDTSRRETLCSDAIDDDGDGRVNDGCPAAGAPEAYPTPNQCAGASDDDGDTVVNDGCPTAFRFDIVVHNLPSRDKGFGQGAFDFQMQWGALLDQADVFDVVARNAISPAIHYLQQATGSSAALMDPSALPRLVPPYVGSVSDLGTEETNPPWSQGTAWRGTAIIQNDATPDIYELGFVPGSVGIASVLPINECDTSNGMGPGCTLQNAYVAVAPMTCDEDKDGVLFPKDNCPAVASTGQLDTDSDRLGDACDAQDDGELRGQERLVVVAIPPADAGRVDLDATGAGYVEGSWIFRCPSLVSGWPCMIVSDRIVFTKDYTGGLGIAVSDADVHDRWTWSYYVPGNPPEGGDPDATCWIEIMGPHELGNPTDFVALVSSCGVEEPTYVQTFETGCPCSFEYSVGVLIPGWGSSSSAPGQQLWTTPTPTA